MYQTVFVSVVGVILVIKIVFLVASILFTVKYENQENRRGSVISLATTLSFDSLESDSSFGQRSDGSAGQNSRVNFLEYSRGDLGESSRRNFGENSRGTFGEPSGIFGEHSHGVFEDGDFGKLRIDNVTGKNDNSSDERSNGNTEQEGRSERKVMFFDPIMHTVSSYNSNNFYEDSFV